MRYKNGSVTIELRGREPYVYTIKFVGYNGAIIEERACTEGGKITPPEAPKVEGYTFSHWDNEFTEVYENTTYTAVYKETHI